MRFWLFADSSGLQLWNTLLNKQCICHPILLHRESFYRVGLRLDDRHLENITFFTHNYHTATVKSVLFSISMSTTDATGYTSTIQNGTNSTKRSYEVIETWCSSNHKCINKHVAVDMAWDSVSRMQNWASTHKIDRSYRPNTGFCSKGTQTTINH